MNLLLIWSILHLVFSRNMHRIHSIWLPNYWIYDHSFSHIKTQRRFTKDNIMKWCNFILTLFLRECFIWLMKMRKSVDYSNAILSNWDNFWICYLTWKFLIKQNLNLYFQSSSLRNQLYMILYTKNFLGLTSTVLPAWTWCMCIVLSWYKEQFHLKTRFFFRLKSSDTYIGILIWAFIAMNILYTGCHILDFVISFCKCPPYILFDFIIQL